MATSQLPLPTLGATIKAHIAAGDKAIDKAEGHYKAAGIHLKEARDRAKEEGTTFSAFIVGHCNINSSRAYELIAIADGRTSVEELRKKKRESVRRSRASSPLRSGQSENDTDDDSKVAAPEVVIDNLLHAIGGMNENARVFKKLLKVSTFDHDAVTQINTAINGTIKKWVSIQSVLGVTTPALNGADVEKLKEQLDAGLRAIESYSDDSADKEVLQAEVDRLTEENERLRAENERLRADEKAGPDWVAVSDSEESADEIIRTEYAIEFRQTMVFEGYDDEPEAQQAKRVLSYVDFQAAGALLGRSAAKNVIKMIRERKRADKQPPEKAALTALRKRAQALGYKTIHRRGNNYHLVTTDGDPGAGGEGLDGMAATLDHMEVFEAGAVQVITTACGAPMSACDKNGPIELDDPRVVEVLDRRAA